jgi:type I restriction-modification system DNA methylase subunit
MVQSKLFEATITLPELESKLWQAANILRGSPVDRTDWKSYILPLLFFKRICDVWDEERDRMVAEYGEAFEDEHRFQIPEGSHWRDVRQVTSNVGTAIQSAMQAVAIANQEHLYGVFGDAQWANKERLPDALLKDLIEHFSSFNLGNERVDSDVMGDAYLRTFDLVLANPPYSIKQWNRGKFQSDPWQRNFLGTPPQGRADYAFFQHILKSLHPQTGRCAILFPHGVLFRREEAEMRQKLVEADLVDCVLGLGPNLFYNSPMEACVVICRTAKPPERRGKILFIDGVKDVARVQAQSFLKPEHQVRVLQAYQGFTDQPGFARVATLAEVAEQDYSLSIPLYVRRTLTTAKPEAAKSLKEIWEDWEEAGREFWLEMDGVVEMLDGLVTEEVSHN